MSQCYGLHMVTCITRIWGSVGCNGAVSGLRLECLVSRCLVVQIPASSWPPWSVLPSLTILCSSRLERTTCSAQAPSANLGQRFALHRASPTLCKHALSSDVFFGRCEFESQLSMPANLPPVTVAGWFQPARDLHRGEGMLS